MGPRGFRAAGSGHRPVLAGELVGGVVGPCGAHAEVIDLGDRAFEVVHTPGHSPGGIALWERKTGTLLSGDIIYDGPLIDDCYHSDLGDYERSLRRLAKLPAQAVHGGHFPSFDGRRYATLIDEYVEGKRQMGCPAESAAR